MALDKQAIQEFQEIYFEEYGSRISDEEAEQVGTALVKLRKILTKPYEQ